MLLWTFMTVSIRCLALIMAFPSSSSSEEEESSMEKDSEDHSKSSKEGHWKYDDQGAWSSSFKHCSGHSQSPIDINTRDVTFDSSLPSIELEGYELTGEEALKLQNNGHTLMLMLPDTVRVVKGFDDVFLASQLHFHWGTTEVPGSEHTVDNVHFPAEIHVVHYNSKYANSSEASSQPDGLAVLGAFLSIGLHENENYEKILSSIKDVSIEESVAEVPGFNIRHLLPTNLDRFYRYNGSLTTPPCFQTVNWTIFNESITVSRRQMAALEDTLKLEQNQHLSKNFRDLQPLLGRRVLSSFQMLPTSKAGGARSPVVDGGLQTEHTGTDPGYSRGDILAMAFGALFTVTLLSFIIYACQQRRKFSRFKKDARQNVIYKPAVKEEA